MIDHNKSSLWTKRLLEKSLDLEVYDVASFILNNPKFDIWSGSSKPEQHHYGKHGLAKHTCEVVDLCFDTMKRLDVEIDPIEVYFSALFHDSGKMYDYEPRYKDSYNEWQGTDHKRLIHHVSRSGLLWSHACSLTEFDYLHDRVLHNILSHHGQREHGSPVMPKTQAAWLLHLCDSLSARMNDCDKIDFVKIKGSGNEYI